MKKLIEKIRNLFKTKFEKWVELSIKATEVLKEIVESKIVNDIVSFTPTKIDDAVLLFIKTNLPKARYFSKFQKDVYECIKYNDNYQEIITCIAIKVSNYKPEERKKFYKLFATTLLQVKISNEKNIDPRIVDLSQEDIEKIIEGVYELSKI
jgi:hypothetical protein